MGWARAAKTTGTPRGELAATSLEDIEKSKLSKDDNDVRLTWLGLFYCRKNQGSEVEERMASQELEKRIWCRSNRIEGTIPRSKQAPALRLLASR
ncbi:hypothetical protein COCNU_13G004210 [Cocos nucifera]|uniref:Uncharacterized protein n=1 Tax=Cocos nucifera TaxID=13894 RepID=A0A8K0NAS7_COCNU|nr:hypothetical protein COCNU_13G004210 [Cocos nucifera]